MDRSERRAMKEKTGLSDNGRLNGYIYYWNNQSLLLLGAFEAAMHRHYPMELHLALERPCRLDFGTGWKEFRTVAIESNRAHRFDGSGGWQALLMIDPACEAAVYLRREALRGESFRGLDAEKLDSFIAAFSEYKERAHPYEEAQALCNDLLRSLSDESAYLEQSSPRIREIMKILRCLPEKKISAEELARRIGLSESRMAHVFKEGTGIPLRPFLLWLRLIEAVKYIFQGMTFTDAAYEAGFADSAHLSRTYKSMTGLNLSDLLRRSPSIRIITSLNRL
jgi:AraC-like DNA-binding protein